VSVWLFCDVLRPECQNFDRSIRKILHTEKSFTRTVDSVIKNTAVLKKKNNSRRTLQGRMANHLQMEVCLKLKTERGAERVEGTIRVGPEDFSFEPVAGGCIGSFRCGANTHEGFASPGLYVYIHKYIHIYWCGADEPIHCLHLSRKMRRKQNGDR